MTKSDLYREIVQQLADYLLSTNVITQAERNPVQDDIDWTRYEDACDKLLTCANIGRYRKVVQYLKAGQSDTDDLTVALNLRNPEAADDDEKRLVDFCYRSNNLTVISAKAIATMMGKPDENPYDSERFSAIEMIWLKDKDNANRMQHFWEICCGQHQKEYYLFTNEIDNPVNNWRLYAYAYFCYVNGGHFQRPTELNFTASREFEPAGITYQSNNRYEQYFDAYNVMSESKFADDVLLRYLRMYQIFEYFGYRKILAGLTKGNIRENGFVRNVISRASSRGTNELNEIKSGVSALIPHLATTARNAGVFAAADITADMETFIKDKLLLPGYTFSDDNLWMVIYKLRNSIVHNKESELHFTYSNTDVYEHGIALMNLIINKLEPEIVRVINDPAITGLEFAEQRVQVY